MLGNACWVIDQQVDTAEMLQYLTDRLFASLRVGDIAADGQDFGIQLVHQLLLKGQQGFVLHVEYGDACAGLGKPQRQRAPDPRATTGNDHHFLLKRAPGHRLPSPCYLPQE